jgi:hypothetical protein
VDARCAVEGHRSFVTALAFAEQSTALASGSGDGSVKVCARLIPEASC